jgi:formylglycine-generating enzyme required for sulfatase activity
MEKIDIYASIHSVPETSFIGKLRKLTGLQFDLPTEAQWEYACRAGTTTGFNNGTDCISGVRDDNFKEGNLEAIAWYGGNWNWIGEESGKKREAGIKQPNNWGLYDMHGQVWEFCLDWYGEYQENDQYDPIGAAKGSRRVTRGGSWHAWPALCRSANRHFERGKFLGQGFRLACSWESRIGYQTNYIVINLLGGEPESVIEFLENIPDDVASNPLYKTDKLVLKRIKAGTFMMGSPVWEEGRDEDENQRETTISNDYFMGLFQVTQKQWEHITGSNPSTNKFETYPVETVSWEEVRGGFWPKPYLAEASWQSTFCGKLSNMTGLVFDLPTEARWEYACRAGTTTAYNNGKDCLTKENSDKCIDPNLEPLAFYAGNWNQALEDNDETGRVVGQKEPNNWNLFDMHGMLWEYCRDWYGPYYGVAEVNPIGPPIGIKKICRGGNWNSWPALCRSAKRKKARAPYGGQGLRLLCENDHIPPEAEYLIVDISQSNRGKVKMRFLTDAVTDLLTNDDYKTTQLVLKRIPAGTFHMGSPENEMGRSDDELQHKVTLTRDFFLGVFLVTQAQWELVMGYNNSVTKNQMAPADNMDWEECTI